MTLMKISVAALALATGLIGSSAGFAQVPATSAPTGSTGLCKDGSYTSTETKQGACAGHKGVKQWFAAAAEAPKATANAATPVVAAKPTVAAPTAATAATPKTPALGGGVGKVWVNKASNVYHCAGTKHYGKTKQGQYMTEAAAKAAGANPDHGKACS